LMNAVLMNADSMHMHNVQAKSPLRIGLPREQVQESRWTIPPLTTLRQAVFIRELSWSYNAQNRRDCTNWVIPNRIRQRFTVVARPL
jgi:hypothetical protein